MLRDLGAAGTGKSTALAERVQRARSDFTRRGAAARATRTHGLDEYAVALLARTKAGGHAHRRRGCGVALRGRLRAALRAANGPSSRRISSIPKCPDCARPSAFSDRRFGLIRRLARCGRDAGALSFARARPAQPSSTRIRRTSPIPSLLSATKNAYSRLARRRCAGARSAASPRDRPRQDPRANSTRRTSSWSSATGRMTGRDAAIAAARSRARGAASLPRDCASAIAFAFVDDAQELTNAQLGLLRAIFGERADGVTLCGDPASAISTRAHDATRGDLRARGSMRRAARTTPARHAASAQRASTARDEAALIARTRRRMARRRRPRRNGSRCSSARCATCELYEAALLDRDVPAVVTGDVNIFEDRRALDALALLWNVHDPFRHEWLLRTLANPAVGLSDASLAMLCGEPRRPAAAALRVRRRAGADRARGTMGPKARSAARLERDSRRARRRA